MEFREQVPGWYAEMKARALAEPEPAPGRPVAACGTRSGYQRHLRRNEEVCGPCREAARAYGRIDAARRAERHQQERERLWGLKKGQWAHPPARCGTRAARRRHKRRGEECQVC